MRRTVPLCVCAVSACLLLSGCESLAKKFVRKPKEPSRPVEMVLEPQDYSTEARGKEVYDRYYLFWKSWHDEFIAALATASRKRQADTAGEALKNLREMRRLLDEQAAARLDPYIAGLDKVRESVALDVYSVNGPAAGREADKLKRLIMSDFSPERVKENLR